MEVAGDLNTGSPRTNPRGQVNEHRPKDQNHATLESPITMRESPIGAMPLLFAVAINDRLVVTMI